MAITKAQARTELKRRRDNKRDGWSKAAANDEIRQAAKAALKVLVGDKAPEPTAEPATTAPKAAKAVAKATRKTARKKAAIKLTAAQEADARKEASAAVAESEDGTGYVRFLIRARKAQAGIS